VVAANSLQSGTPGLYGGSNGLHSGLGTPAVNAGLAADGTVDGVNSLNSVNGAVALPAGQSAYAQ